MSAPPAPSTSPTHSAPSPLASSISPTHSAPSPLREKSILRSGGCGCLAGLVSRFVISPLDVIKIRLQLQSSFSDTRNVSLNATLPSHISRNSPIGVVRTAIDLMRHDGVWVCRLIGRTDCGWWWFLSLYLSDCLRRLSGRETYPQNYSTWPTEDFSSPPTPCCNHRSTHHQLDWTIPHHCRIWCVVRLRGHLPHFARIRWICCERDSLHSKSKFVNEHDFCDYFDHHAIRLRAIFRSSSATHPLSNLMKTQGLRVAQACGQDNLRNGRCGWLLPGTEPDASPNYSIHGHDVCVI